MALLLVAFVAAAAVVWVAGVKLATHTEILSARLHLGSALGGIILLAIATNVPEIAITVSAAISGNVEIAVGNILGGIALQTVVFVVLDVFGVRGKNPLSNQAASLTLVIEAAMVVALLAAVIVGTQLPADLIFFRVTPDTLLIVVLWIGGLLLVRRARKGLPWRDDDPDDEAGQAGQAGQGGQAAGPDQGKISTARSALVFSLAAGATLVAGFVLERSGSAMAEQIGLSGILFGATILALATSLPEISSGLKAVRQSDFQLAVSDVFGGNAFLPVLFFVATLISGKSVLSDARGTDVYLTALAMLLTLIYLIGLLFRPRRRFARMGVDSIAVLALYSLGIVGLFAVAGGS